MEKCKSCQGSGIMIKYGKDSHDRFQCGICGGAGMVDSSTNRLIKDLPSVKPMPDTEQQEREEKPEPKQIELPYVLAYSKLLCQLIKIPSSIFVEYGVDIPDMEQVNPEPEAIKTLQECINTVCTESGYTYDYYLTKCLKGDDHWIFLHKCTLKGAEIFASQFRK